MKTSCLTMPVNYSVMENEEMEYVDGGKTMGYNPLLATTAGAAGAALAFQIQNGYWNISTPEMAAEIYSHAAAYYAGSAFLAACSAVGYSASTIRNSSFWKSINNGIDLANGRDTATIGGVQRYIIFNAVYAYAALNPIIP